MEIGETVTFWRNCPDCKGKGVLVCNAFVPDASMMFHPSNLRQCPRCVEEKARIDELANRHCRETFEANVKFGGMP